MFRKSGYLLVALILPVTIYASGNNTADVLPQQVKQCDRCHSENSTVRSIAPSLDGMSDTYLVEQLENFRQARRGADSADPYTLEMSQQAKALDEEQVARLANYYAGRKRRPSTGTVPGNVGHGEQLYKEKCGGCHSSLFGRFFTRSPRITHLKASYILAELSEFATGERRVKHDSKHKLKMVAVAKQLNDVDRADIVAYIKAAPTH